MDRDSDEGSTDIEATAEILQDNDRDGTDDEAGEVAEGEEAEMGDKTAIGETVTKGGEDDPQKKHGHALKLCPLTLEQKRLKTQNLRI
jgi:hypothetical protein